MYRYLWTRILPKPDSKFVGCLNDTLEADKIEAGNLAPRLDGNAATNPSVLSIVDVRLHAQNLPTHIQTGLH